MSAGFQKFLLFSLQEEELGILLLQCQPCSDPERFLLTKNDWVHIKGQLNSEWIQKRTVALFFGDFLVSLGSFCLAMIFVCLVGQQKFL